jgi:hypothetical protein
MRVYGVSEMNIVRILCVSTSSLLILHVHFLWLFEEFLNACDKRTRSKVHLIYISSTKSKTVVVTVETPDMMDVHKKCIFSSVCVNNTNI